MGITRSYPGHFQTAVQEREPAMDRLHPVRAHRAGIDQFNPIECERKIAPQILSGDAIEVSAREWSETTMNVGGVIQDDHADLWRLTDALQEGRPILNIVINRRRPQTDRKNIKVAAFGG